MKPLKIIISAAIVTIMSMTASSCGGSRDKDTPRIVDEQSTQLVRALETHDINSASSLADSMALYVDDLTPDETVAVLLTFLEIHNNAVANGDRETDLETIRKYIDVYDIATSNNPNDMRNAFSRASRINPQVDFETAARDFRRALAEYDAVRTYGETPVPEPADTTATEAAPDSISSATISE